MRTLAGAVLLAAAGAVCGAGPEDGSLGRLFFTPEERGRLDGMRNRPTIPSEAPAAQAEVPTSRTVTLQGVVQRESGERVIWVNGVAQSQKLPAGARTAAPQGAPVAVPGSDRPVDMKVGQTLEVESGQVREGAIPAARPPGKSGGAAPRPP